MPPARPIRVIAAGYSESNLSSFAGSSAKGCWMVSSWPMVCCSSGRSSRSSPARVPEASLMSAIAPASGSARFFRPVIRVSKFTTVESNSFWCLTTVPSTVLRLVITSPIAWSRSARVEVNCAVWLRMSLIVPPWPWNTVTSEVAMLLTFSGSSDLKSGLNPPISASRSSAGWVRATGMKPPGGNTRSAPSPVPRSRLR